jgi:acetoin utilization protein AcuB
MSSILSSYDRAPTGFRNVYIRFFQIDRKKLLQLQNEVKEKAKILYVVDHRENKREIYQDWKGVEKKACQILNQHL